MMTIDEKYAHIIRTQGPLGSPVEDEHLCSDGLGRLRRFERGAVYWHPKVGAHPLYGAILTKWLELGGECSHLGYPTSDELTSWDGAVRCSCFQGGRIYSYADKRVQVTDLTSDAAVSDWIVFNAKPASLSLQQAIKGVGPWTASLDYSADANFVRNQGSSPGGTNYGCMTYALLHCLDILKDWEHPYTPAVSWHYAEWWAVSYIQSHGAGPDVQVQADAGFASEGLCHTDYDTEFHWGPPDAWGYPVAEWTEPSQAAKEEALIYRVHMPHPNSAFVTVPTGNAGIDLIKSMLRTYGPIWSIGWGHAKAIVGYDDTKREFKILDSYPHPETGGHNLTVSSYDNVGFEIAAVSEIYNLPTPQRATGKHAFSARIGIDGKWRGTYTVSIGVEGKTPLVVYTTCGRDLQTPGVALDPSPFLKIDVPLPDYAQSCWPPSAKNRWFLRVEDHDRDGATGSITEVTLARRYRHPDCESVGKYRTEAFGGALSIPIPDPTTGELAPYPGTPDKKPNPTPNPNPGVAIVYIPARVASGGSGSSHVGGSSVQPLQRHYGITLQRHPPSGPMTGLRGFVVFLHADGNRGPRP